MKSFDPVCDVAGSQLILDADGSWPNFHDDEITQLSISRGDMRPNDNALIGPIMTPRSKLQLSTSHSSFQCVSTIANLLGSLGAAGLRLAAAMAVAADPYVVDLVGTYEHLDDHYRLTANRGSAGGFLASPGPAIDTRVAGRWDADDRGEIGVRITHGWLTFGGGVTYQQAHANNNGVQSLSDHNGTVTSVGAIDSRLRRLGVRIEGGVTVPIARRLSVESLPFVDVGGSRIAIVGPIDRIDSNGTYGELGCDIDLVFRVSQGVAISIGAEIVFGANASSSSLTNVLGTENA